MDPLDAVVAAALLLAIAWYFLRADPAEVDKETSAFYKRLYQQDSRH